MKFDQEAGVRRRHILQALNDNGPLSVEVLGKIIRPQMSARSIQYAIKRLREKGLITCHFESLNYKSGHFFRISHDLSARGKIAKWLGVPVTELRQPKFFAKELQHTTQCALWAAILRDTFPDGEVVRDVQLVKRKILRETDFVGAAERDLVPDILLNFSCERKDSSVSIGVEIERTRKSEKRLAGKIHKLIVRSQLDGVIYVCDAGGIKDAIQDTLERRELLQSRRIRHYGRVFLLFTDCTEIHKPTSPKMFNVEGKTVSLEAWVNALRTISANFRRDSDFFAS
jgi:hypothetical protein